MVDTLRNFTIGLGLDTTQFDDGERNVVSGLNNIRTVALAAGATAAIAIGSQLASNFAESTNELDRFSRLFAVLPDEVRGLGAAAEEQGGSLDGVLNTLEQIERLRASTPQQIGGLFAEAGIRGIDPSVILEAESATEAYLALADVLGDLTPQERLQAQPVLGLSNADLLVLQQGREEIESIIARQTEIRPFLTDDVENIREYNRQWVILNSNVGAVTDSLGSRFIPVVNEALDTTNEVFRISREQDVSLPDAASIILDDFITDVIGEDASSNEPSLLDQILQDIQLLFGGEPQASQQPVVVEPPVSNAQFNIGDEVSRAARPISVFNPFDQVEREPLTFNPFTQQAPPQVNPFANIGAPTTPPPQPSVDLPPLSIRLELDGQVLDQRIINLNERQDSQALEEITSTIRG